MEPLDREREPHRTDSFLEVVEQLRPDDCLYFGHDQARLLTAEGEWTQIPITNQYEEVNAVAARRYQARGGEDITAEFFPAVRHLAGERPSSPLPYPSLTVINDATGKSKTEVLNIARLVARDRLPIRGFGEKLQGQYQEVVVDVESLVRSMARQVGVHSPDIITLKDGEVFPLCEVGLDSLNVLSTGADVSMNIEPLLDTRGEAALALLQMHLVETVKESDLQVVGPAGPSSILSPTRLPPARIEAELRVAPQPDLQQLLLELITLAESADLRLVCSAASSSGRKPSFGQTGGDIEYEFSLQSANSRTGLPTGEVVTGLLGDRLFDMAIIKAYEFTQWSRWFLDAE